SFTLREIWPTGPRCKASSISAPYSTSRLDANSRSRLVDTDIVGVLDRHVITFQDQGGDGSIRRFLRQAGQQGAQAVLADGHMLAGPEDAGGSDLLTEPRNGNVAARPEMDMHIEPVSMAGEVAIVAARHLAGIGAIDRLAAGFHPLPDFCQDA